MMNLLKMNAAVAVAGLCGIVTAAHAGPITVEMTTNPTGVVPGTSVSYTISISGDDGGPRNIFPSASSDNNVWTWPGPNPNFPEFLSFGQGELLVVQLSAPLSIDHLVFGMNSISATSSIVNVLVGAATTSDLNLTDSLQVYTGPTGAATFDPGTGIISATGQNQSIMIGSTSTNTFSVFSLGAGPSGGGADGYTVFVGFTVPTPEPSQGIMLGGALCLLLLGKRIFGFARQI